MMLPIPTKLQHQKTLHKLIKQVNVSNIEQNLLKLTSFHTRFYRTSSGAAASEWIQSILEEYKSTASKGWNITITPFKHDWVQNSIIVRLEDKNATKEKEGKMKETEKTAVMILGAHLDSVNWLNPWWGRSPGADDDGSGTPPASSPFILIPVHYSIPSSSPSDECRHRNPPRSSPPNLPQLHPPLATPRIPLLQRRRSRSQRLPSNFRTLPISKDPCPRDATT